MLTKPMKAEAQAQERQRMEKILEQQSQVDVLRPSDEDDPSIAYDRTRQTDSVECHF